MIGLVDDVMMHICLGVVLIPLFLLSRLLRRLELISEIHLIVIF